LLAGTSYDTMMSEVKKIPRTLYSRFRARDEALYIKYTRKI